MKKTNIHVTITVPGLAQGFTITWPWLHRVLKDNYAGVTIGEYRIGLVATPPAKPLRKKT